MKARSVVFNVLVLLGIALALAIIQGTGKASEAAKSVAPGVSPSWLTGTTTETTVENGLPPTFDRTASSKLPTQHIDGPQTNVGSVRLTNQITTTAPAMDDTVDVPPVPGSLQGKPTIMAQPLTLPASTAIPTTFSEGFDDISTLAGKGWAMQNKSDPLGFIGWFQGDSTIFPAQSGVTTTSYIGADYRNTMATGTISNWLLTPETPIKNGDRVNFYTRTTAGSAWPDRLEVRMSEAGASTDVGTTATSVGVFTTLLLSINPSLVVGGYPEEWTMYTLTVSGLSAPTSGRFAFRYFVTNAGPSGTNAAYIGIDSFNFTPAADVLYDNGPLVTSPGAGFGGADASAVQTSLGMITFGFNHSVSGGYRIADDFTVTAPGGWDVTSITFLAYQTGSTITPTIDAVDYRIWNGVPGAPGSSVVFGDTSTNRLTNSTFSGIYRVNDTGLLATDRPVMSDTVSAGFHLDPGTYWVDWQTGGTLALGPWAPPISIIGRTTTGNALQFDISPSIWVPAVDIGTSSPQGFPFVVRGTAHYKTYLPVVLK